MPGPRFVQLDRLLDHAGGPAWLKNPQVAEAVVETLFTAERQCDLDELFAWVVMSDHVHVLLKPVKPPREVTRAIKSTSARLASRILNRQGFPFWLDESFDHLVRTPTEFEKVVHYIERNPAGLVREPEEWPWSSASARFRKSVATGRSETCPT